MHTILSQKVHHGCTCLLFFIWKYSFKDNTAYVLYIVYKTWQMLIIATLLFFFFFVPPPPPPPQVICMRFALTCSFPATEQTDSRSYYYLHPLSSSLIKVWISITTGSLQLCIGANLPVTPARFQESKHPTSESLLQHFSAWRPTKKTVKYMSKRSSRNDSRLLCVQISCLLT